jgi:hypothetical protein
MLLTLILILIILWLLGVFGRRRIPRIRAGNWIHILLIIVLILIVLKLLGVD